MRHRLSTWLDRPSIQMVLWPGAVALVASVLTVVVALTDLQFAVRSAEGRILLETAQAIISALIAYLLFGRAKRAAHQRDLLIAAAFTIFAFTSILFLSARLGGTWEPGSRLERVALWGPLSARTVATALLAGATLISPAKRTTHDRGVMVLAGAATTVIVAALGTSLLADRLPPGIADELLLDSGTLPGIRAHPVLQALQIALIGLYAVAALGLIARRDESGDHFATTLATGLTAAAFARLNFYLYPSIYSDVVHVGDVLRLLFFIILLLGAVVEINRYWRVEAEASAMRERERLARELHDGLTQELSFIRSQAVAMANGMKYPEMAQLVAESADRAVVESRALLVHLRGDAVVVAHDALAAEARRAAGTMAAVSLEVPRGLILPQAVSHELARIVHEASSNAVRHGAATTLRVCVVADDGLLTLIVADNGNGFDTADIVGVGQGLRGIKERAELLGGTASVQSGAGIGTTVEVVVPHPDWSGPRK